MKQVTITAVRRASYPDLSARYENPIAVPCEIDVGQTFAVTEDRKPDGLCDSAWETLRPFALALLNGGGNFYDGWMKNPHSAMLSCNDGFRPVSFYLELSED